MPYVVRFTTAARSATGQDPHSALVVEADEHRVEGSWHVFRQTVRVMGRPRTVVALRLPLGDVADVSLS